MMSLYRICAALFLSKAAVASDGNLQVLRFEPNAGQTGRTVDFVSRLPGMTVFLTPAGVTVRSNGKVWQMILVGANTQPARVGLDRMSAPSHYLVGPPDQWRRDVPSYARVEYRNVYPGVDLVYSGDRGRLEYEFLIAAGGDPGRIVLRFEGTDRMQFEPGNSMGQTGGSGARGASLSAHEIREGRRVAVDSRLVAMGPDEVALSVPRHDRLESLVLTYSTYLGGGGQDSATSLAVDASGNSYVAGYTESTDFPEAAGARFGSPRGVDAYIAKLSPTGSLVYVAYLGGSGDDRAFGVAVDSGSSPVIAGWTTSSDFPAMNAAQAVSGGGKDGFVAKLSPSGNGLVFSTYIGGSGSESVNGAAVDPAGYIYVAGETTSANFPVMNPLQPSSGGGNDAFVAKYNGSGVRMYGTRFGGLGDDRATAIAVDGAGYAYITGSTYSPNLPVLNAFQPALHGGQDAFAAKIGLAGNALVYCTYLGGSGGSVASPESGSGIAVDSGGYAYVAGSTSSSNFPTTSAFQSSSSGGEDAFVSKLSVAGNALVYSTYLGGSSVDMATAIAVDGAGRAYLAGYTASMDFPLKDAIQSSNAGGYDAFLAVLGSAGNTLEQATYLGGVDSDSANGIGLDGSGTVHVAGQTLSTGFPTMGAIQVFKAAPATGFVAAVGPGITAPSPVGLRFVPVTPCRVMDTRNPTGPFGGPAISGGSSRDFSVRNSGCGIPSTAQAYALNVTVVPGASLGALTVWATGQSQPLVPTLNSIDGRIKAGAAIVPAGDGGQIRVFATDTVNVIIDVNGYFAPQTESGGLAFYPAPPCRVVDTRDRPGPLAGPSLSAGAIRTFPVLSAPCGIPNGAQAYALNFTAIPKGSLGFVSAWPTGRAQPLVSVLNALTGAITANAAITPAGTGGSIDVVATDNADLVIDITGYFAAPAPGGLSLYVVNACRILDTAPMSGTKDVLASSSCPIPATAQALVLNATVMPSGPFDFLSLWPTASVQPSVSTLNALDGAVTSNLAIVPLSGGWISAFLTQSAQLLLDTNSYFAP